MKKTIRSLVNKAICAAFVVLGAASVCAEVAKEPIYDAENVSVGYKVTGLNDGKEEAVVFTNHLRTATWTVPANLENVQFLVVGGGGGGGGGTWGPGGGGGGVVTGYVYQLKKDVAVDITVGAGGNGGTSNGGRGGYGKDSSIFVSDVSYVVAKGGGAGRTKAVGGDGGSSSGGGASSSNSYAGGNVVTNDYDSTFVFAESFGEKGGANGKSAYCSGGGGGATGVGSAGSGSKGGAGGAGLKMDITGSLIIYGSGGGGGGRDTKGSGGTNAGNGGSNGGNATSAEANRGGGGGGGGKNTTSGLKGGAGGSGIVVLRYALPNTIAKIGETEYTSISEAVAAAVSNDIIKLEKDIVLNETFVIPATKEDLTIDLNGKTISGAEGAKLSNLGTLTVTDSSSEMTGMFEVKFANAGTANLKGGVFTLGVENTGTIEVTGGAYLASAFNRAWVKPGYVCCDLGDDETAIIAVAKLPTATITSITNAELEEKNAPKDLNYTLKFKANRVSDFQMLCFTNWYADFEFTISADATFNCSSATSDGYLAGQYDSWAKNWISVPTTDVELKANEPLRIMDFGAGLLKKPGLKMTYGEVATLVKEFSCGVALRPEFVAKNPGLTVKLALKMYNPKNESEFYTIGEEYTFELPAETDNAIIVDASGATINCESLQAAINAVGGLEADADGSQIAILKNYEVSEDLTVSGTRNLFFDIGENKSITLAEGKKLTISGANVAFVGAGSLVGFTADNIELEDKSVLTLPEAAQALAESFEAKGKYVTQNDDETWSVANELTLQIQVVDGEPTVGFLKDVRREYTIEGSADLKSWGDVEAEDDNLTQGADIALPLKWHKPASSYFFRVKAEKKSN